MRHIACLGFPESQTVTCGTSATLDRYIAGSGTAQIEVTDGAGRWIYDQPADVTGEAQRSGPAHGHRGNMDAHRRR